MLIQNTNVCKYRIVICIYFYMRMGEAGITEFLHKTKLKPKYASIDE